MQFDFDTVFRQLKLGTLTVQPQRVTGGYLHRMFRVETHTGKYAVKLLNPLIMKRPGVLEDYKRAGRIERILSEHHIPIIPALEFGGSTLHCLNGQYFYIFRWSDAKAMEQNQIQEEHCRIIGRLLARIHKLPLGEALPDPSDSHPEKSGSHPEKSDSLSEPSGSFSEKSDYLSENAHGSFTRSRDKHFSPGKFCMDWDEYICLAEKMHSELAGALAENRDLLYLAQQEYNAAIDSLPDIVCISDGDMDCKNVLWKNGKPLIIDLECLDYGNPFLEMFRLALSWAGGDVCHIDPGRLEGFLEAYRLEYGEISVDWERILGAGFSWLEWLEYNIKRALRIECGDEEEQKLGIREAQETIRRIVYYHSVRKDVVKSCRCS